MTMACEACGREGVSGQAVACPGCGHPVGKILESRRRTRHALRGLLFAGVGVLMMFSGNEVLSTLGALTFIVGVVEFLIGAVTGWFVIV